MDGFLLVNKPVNMTSHDVVKKVKRKLKLDKVGHTGTLDPFASGLLILTIGKATKLSYLFSEQNKVYEGIICFGAHYDTYDFTGKIIDENEPLFDEMTLKNQMQQMIQTYDQMPPMYSAIKKDGRKLYDLARQGIDVKRNHRQVHILDFKPIGSYQNNEIKFYAKVSKGTYIRSLAVDLSTALHTYGALKTLNRISIGDYHLKDSKEIDELEIKDIIPMEVLFLNCQTIELNDYMVRLVKNGILLDERQTDTKDPFVVIDKDKKMIAYYEPIDGNRYAPIVIF